jgi:hypothetical protein
MRNRVEKRQVAGVKATDVVEVARGVHFDLYLITTQSGDTGIRTSVTLRRLPDIRAGRPATSGGH